MWSLSHNQSFAPTKTRTRSLDSRTCFGDLSSRAERAESDFGPPRARTPCWTIWSRAFEYRPACTDTFADTTWTRCPFSRDVRPSHCTFFDCYCLLWFVNLLEIKRDFRIFTSSVLSCNLSWQSRKVTSVWFRQSLRRLFSSFTRLNSIDCRLVSSLRLRISAMRVDNSRFNSKLSWRNASFRFSPSVSYNKFNIDIQEIII